MRISADPKHPDYLPESVNAEVFFNGVKQFNCISADDEIGIITRHRLDNDKRPLIDNGVVLTETVTGDVEIVMAHDNVGAKEIVRKLRLTVNLPTISKEDYDLLMPIVECYRPTRNPNAINDKQAELVVVTYNKYFTE
jgi:hypothetical protein